MQRLIVVSIVSMISLFAGSLVVDAQERAGRRPGRRDPLPPDVVREIASVWNDPRTTRVDGRLEVPEDRTINGDLAVAGGPTLTIAGRVAGRVVAVNTDVILEHGARVDGDILIVGGRFTRPDRADDVRIGDVRVYPQALQYAIEGDRLVPSERQDTRTPFERGVALGQTVSRLSVNVSPYNRVEGLPIHGGPELRVETGDVALHVQLFGTMRSANDFQWEPENIGHDALVEIRSAASRGIGLGGTLYDRVDPIERWHLKDTEVGLATFFLHRDFRDYYDRHGGGIHVLAFSGTEQEFTLGYREERWGSRVEQDPWTLFRDDQTWRPNPLVDEGKMHLATARFRYNTRDDDEDPLTGWLIDADVEHGSGDLIAPFVGAVEREVKYTRGFADIRRYNRLSRDAQFNLRLVYGGWIGGDSLPLQRRFSVGGVGTIPGFDFRKNPGGPDVGTCTTGVPTEAMPALCDRVFLAQIEWRASLGFGRLREMGDRRWWGDRDSPNWVVFADAGRGWLVGDEDADDEVEYSESTIVPPLGTFRTDLGFGLDAGFIGFFIAKSVSHSKEPANFFVRIRHLF